jgi:YHS domain-containing protein
MDALINRIGKTYYFVDEDTRREFEKAPNQEK